MVAKEELCESTDVRRTKSGGILVELKAGVKGDDTSFKIKESTGGKVLVYFLQNRASVEIRDIDTLETRDDLRQDIVNGVKIKDANEVEVKSLRAAPSFYSCELSFHSGTSHVITGESSVWVCFLNEESGFVVHTFR